MNPIYVLDLGSTKVGCLAATLSENGGIRVEGVSIVGCSGVKKGLICDVEAVSAAIDEAASRVERAIGNGIDELTVGISGSHLKGVNAQGFVPIHPNSRQIRRDDVLAVIGHSRQVVLPSDREQIMAVPREFRIDGQRGISKPIGMTGGRLEVVTHIVTGQTSAINLIDRAVNLSGRKVSEMVIQSLASGLGVVPPDAIDEGCLVVDIGATTTNVAIFANGAVAFTSVIPIGSHHVTTDLEALLKVSLEEAERLKTQYGAALSQAAKENESVQVSQRDQSEPRPMQRRVLCEIIESRMREIANLVQKQVETSGLGGQLKAGVFVTGGGSMMPAIGTLFGEVMDTDKIHMAYPKVVGQNARTVEVPTMSALVGLARYCLESDEHEFAPVSGFSNWKEKIRTIKNPFSKKA